MHMIADNSLIKKQLGNYPDNLLLNNELNNQDSLDDLVNKSIFSSTAIMDLYLWISSAVELVLILLHLLQMIQRLDMFYLLRLDMKFDGRQVETLCLETAIQQAHLALHQHRRV